MKTAAQSIGYVTYLRASKLNNLLVGIDDGHVTEMQCLPCFSEGLCSYYDHICSEESEDL